MPLKLPRLLRAPDLQDPEQALAARKFWAVILGSAALNTVFVILVWAFQGREAGQAFGRLFIGSLLLNLIALGCLELLRRGRITICAWIYIGQILLMQFYLALHAGGLWAPGNMALLLAVAIAGLLLGPRAAAWVAVATVVSSGLVLLAHLSDKIPTPSGVYTPLQRWLLYIQYVSTLLVVQFLVGWIIKYSERKAREQEQRRSAAEQALLERELTHRRMFETMMDGVIRFDTLGRIVETNGVLRKMLGYDEKEMVGRWEQDLTPDTWHAIDKTVLEQQLQKQGWSEPYEKEYLHKDGTHIPVELRHALLHDSAGTVTGSWCFIRNISRRKAIEEQYRQAQKMEAVGQLAGGIAHDYNNLLTAEHLQLTLFLSEPHLPPDIRAGLEGLRELSQRSARLTRQLLTFSRKQPIAMTDLDLNQVATDVSGMLGRLIGAHIRVTYDFAKNTPPVQADLGMLEQVLTNLLVNARDAIGEAGGSILISTRLHSVKEDTLHNGDPLTAGDYACLSVKDSGCGMTPEVQTRLFEPFFTTKEIGKGTGLGLATVFGIIRQHRGWIKVISSPGQGSEFQIFLPKSTHPTPSNEKTTWHDYQRGEETVLLVEDDHAVLTATTVTLRKLGYRVIPTEDGPSALGAFLAQDGDIDVLVTDTRLPGGIQGLEIARQVQAARPDMAIIIVSGYSEDLNDKDLAAIPGAEFLMKPFDIGRLADTLRKTITKSKQRA